MDGKFNEITCGSTNLLYNYVGDISKTYIIDRVTASLRNLVWNNTTSHLLLRVDRYTIIEGINND